MAVMVMEMVVIIVMLWVVVMVVIVVVMVVVMTMGGEDKPLTGALLRDSTIGGMISNETAVSPSATLVCVGSEVESKG